MGLKDRLQRALQTNVSGERGATSAAPAPTPVDPNLPDDQWLATSERAYKDSVDAYYGSPETLSEQGHDRWHVFFYGPRTAAVLLGHSWNRMPPTQLWDDLGPARGYTPAFVIEG